ncbi:MAG: hypothetical protein K2P09_01775 [Erysipelotrichales bacterium]|nr:hypothetical protein [Erysipelotrichales bacterium]
MQPLVECLDEQFAFLRNLIDSQCSEDTINKAICLYRKKDYKALILLLRKHRCCLLEGLHEKQSEIDCLDYLIYHLSKKCD